LVTIALQRYSSRQALESISLFHPFISFRFGEQDGHRGIQAAANKDTHYNTVLTKLKEFENLKSLMIVFEPQHRARLINMAEFDYIVSNISRYCLSFARRKCLQSLGRSGYIYYDYRSIF
jgi:hypothetical protein